MVYDVVIIGAGQAGLSIGYFLQKSNLSFIILDKSTEAGEVWRERYDSLTLFTPHFYSSLPGLKLNDNKNTYPTKDEISLYLKQYKEKFNLPVQLNTFVQQLLKGKNCFEISTNQGDYTAKNVIVATGPFQTALIPEISKTISDHIFQLHSSEYKNPMQLKKGPVLVVGGGNSGAQIAAELSNERDVYLSIGHKLKFLPLNIGEKSIFWYFDKMGIYRANTDSIIGKFIKKQNDPIFGIELKNLIRNNLVKLKPRAISVDDDSIIFLDKSELKVSNIIWATGFKPNYEWINLSLDFAENGLPIHKRGITSVEGLYFLGLPWQSSRGSALIQGAGRDAEYLYHCILSS
ncbi:flavin-containing monooxygenase [Mesobacillus jeotgali]|uniref:flavin-containing monooxygenase n=1 Tax=Mesobacillus jeotgali TaxID=129985 RepID=UPI0009A79359|nr:NAD(P)/FAD-dependent oxidoreductase [Mesobacillus jeotgali]